MLSVSGAEHCIDIQGRLAATFETKLVRGEQNPRGMPDNFSDKYLEIYSDIAGDSTTHLLKCSQLFPIQYYYFRIFLYIVPDDLYCEEE